jgi:stage III sporulation protein AH
MKKIDLSRIKEALKRFVAKVSGRNLVIIGCVLLVGAAVLVNWLVLRGMNDSNGASLDLDGLDKSSLENVAASGESDYFAASVLSRQKARDEAMEVLSAVAENPSALQEAKDRALSDMQQIALDMEREANIETLVMSKGFDQCIAVVNGTTASVIVKSNGLLPNEISQIYEIVYEQAGIEPSNVHIIEKGA